MELGVFIHEYALVSMDSYRNRRVALGRAVVFRFFRAEPRRVEQYQCGKFGYRFHAVELQPATVKLQISNSK